MRMPWWDEVSEENVERLQAPPIGVQMVYYMAEHPPFLSCDLRFPLTLSDSLRRERQRTWAARTIKNLRMNLRMEWRDRGVCP